LTEEGDMQSQSKKIKVIALICVLALVLALGAGCGSKDNPEPQGTSSASVSTDGSGGDAAVSGDTIKIGYVLPLSGPMAIFSFGAIYTEEEALRIINEEKGGIDIGGTKMKLEVIWGDSESDPTKASEVATKLVT
jgi:branched-chain amino acid transport system substrate-binding protein